jgi:hypothetical protein
MLAKAAAADEVEAVDPTTRFAQVWHGMGIHDDDGDDI